MTLFPIENPLITKLKRGAEKKAKAESAASSLMNKLRASVEPRTEAEADILGATSEAAPRVRTPAEADPFGATITPEERARTVIARAGSAPESTGIPPISVDQFTSRPPSGVQSVPGRVFESIDTAASATAGAVNTARKAVAGAQLIPGSATEEEIREARLVEFAEAGFDITNPRVIERAESEASMGRGTVGSAAITAATIGATVAEPVIEPLDVLAETGAEAVAQIPKVVTGNFGDIEAPTLFTEGYAEALEQFRDRSLLVQMILGAVFDPIVVGKFLKIPAKASASVVRGLVRAEVARAMPGASRDIVSRATDDVLARMGDVLGNQRGGTRVKPGQMAEILDQLNRKTQVEGAIRNVDNLEAMIERVSMEIEPGPVLEQERSVLRDQLARAEDELNSLFKESTDPETLLPPIDPPGTSPRSGPGLSAEPPSGRPRTVADLTREARGLRGMTPEARAAIMDARKPVGDTLFQVEDYTAPAARLLGPDTTVNTLVRRVPGAKQVAGTINPAQVGRDNPVQMIGVRAAIFKDVETARARFAITGWWNDAQPELGFKRDKGIWRATKVKLAEGADTLPRSSRTINDLIEHPERYVLTPEQSRVLQLAMNTQTQILRDAQRAGVNAVELSTDYWRRIVIKQPRGPKLFDNFIQKRVGSRKGHTLQRAFTDIDEGIELGYKYETDPRAILGERIEAGITSIADQRARREVSNLVGVDKPLERIQAQFPDTIEGVAQARAARDGAKGIYLAKGGESAGNFMSLRQAEADYVIALRDLFVAKRQVSQPGFSELALPNGRIAPRELVDQVNKYLELPELGRGKTDGLSKAAQDTFRLFRTVLTSMDLSASFIQGQALFFRNPVAWWKSMSASVVAIVNDPTAYVARNIDVIDEGVRMGAITSPTEFLFASRGIASVPTKIPLLGPAFKASNRAFEWFILVAQTELYSAGRARIARQGGAVDELVSLGTAIRKAVGTENYAILGIRPTQQTIESMALFAPRFYRAMTGIMAQAFTSGAGGAEARRVMGSLLAGGTALLYGVHWAVTGREPNVTRPMEPDWMQVPIGNTFFSPFGPFYTYFRALAQIGWHTANGDLGKAALVGPKFLLTKASIPIGLAEIGIDLVSKGEHRTFDGDIITRNPVSIVMGVGKENLPIAPSEIVQGLQQGRPEALADIIGITGRSSPFAQMFILFQRALDINPEGKPYSDAEPWQKDEMKERFPEIASRMLASSRGKFGDARRAWAEVDAKYYTQEEALGEEFLSGITTGEDLRDRYGRIQGDKAAEKQQVNTSLGLFQEDQELPDDPNDRAVAEFYQVQRQATRESGIYDFALAEVLMGELDAQWTEEQRGYVDRLTGRATHPPLIQEFRDDVALLKPYWDIEEEFISGLPSEKAKELWAEYRTADPVKRAQLQGVLRPIIEGLSARRRAYRAGHPEADAALARWGYAGRPMTQEGRDALRSGEATPAPPVTPPTPRPLLDRLRQATQ